MKKKHIITVLSLLISHFAYAKNYYFSSVTGNDSYTSQQAQNPATPWKTLKRLNNFFPNIRPGDFILFKRGETFEGNITITKPGSAAAPITFGAYGSGPLPIISGFAKLTAWNNVEGGIWESNCPSCKPSVNMVTLNGIQQSIGRYPNSGYLIYQSHSGNVSITDDKLAGSPNWTGAELVIRKNHYIIDRAHITSHRGNTITYTGSSNYVPTNKFGYFIQNDPKTLDQTGEWYFDPVKKNMEIFFGASRPSSYVINASITDTLINISHANYVTFENIAFQGANISCFQIENSEHILIKDCDINFSGRNGITSAGAVSYLSVLNSAFNNTNNNAIDIVNMTYAHDILISGDSINNTGTLTGMGKNQDGQTERTAIYIKGANNIVENCVINNTGYVPIWPLGNNFLVKNNFISNFCTVKDDGGGIWTWNNPAKPVTYKEQKIIGNIIINGIGALDGSVVDKQLGASGIYCDNNSANIDIENNTVANCNVWGILVHDAHEITIKNNTVYNSLNSQLSLYDDDNTTYNKNVASPIRNIISTDNILFSKDLNQFLIYATTKHNDVARFGLLNNNYYGRPVSEPNGFFTYVVGIEKWPGIGNSLSNWRSKYNFDPNSKEKIIKPTDYVRFEYNATGKSKNISLDRVYTDIKDRVYTGKLTLAPYSSVILISTALSSGKKNPNPPKQPGGKPVVY